MTRTPPKLKGPGTAENESRPPTDLSTLSNSRKKKMVESGANSSLKQPSSGMTRTPPKLKGFTSRELADCVKKQLAERKRMIEELGEDSKMIPEVRVEAFGYNKTSIAAYDKLVDMAKEQEKLKTNH